MKKYSVKYNDSYSLPSESKLLVSMSLPSFKDKILELKIGYFRLVIQKSVQKASSFQTFKAVIQKWEQKSTLAYDVNINWNTKYRPMHLFSWLDKCTFYFIE